MGYPQRDRRFALTRLEGIAGPTWVNAIVYAAGSKDGDPVTRGSKSFTHVGALVARAEKRVAAAEATLAAVPAARDMDATLTSTTGCGVGWCPTRNP
jgi:hypothetical protein